MIRDVSSRLSIRTLLSTKIHIFKENRTRKTIFVCGITFCEFYECEFLETNFMNEGFHILISGLFLYKS